MTKSNILQLSKCDAVICNGLILFINWSGKLEPTKNKEHTLVKTKISFFNQIEFYQKSKSNYLKFDRMCTLAFLHGVKADSGFKYFIIIKIF